MAKYVRHFLESAYSAVPSGVSVFYSTAGELLAASVGIVTAELTKDFGDRALRFSDGTVAAGRRRAFQLDAAAADAGRANAELLARFAGAVGANSSPFLGARCSGVGSSATGYFAELRPIAGQVAIVKVIAGALTDLATVAFAFTGTAAYRLRFRVQGGNLFLRAWADGAAEPAAWTLTAADAGISAAGALTVGAKAGALGGVVGLCSWLCIGTNGDPAPLPPKSWAEYVAFLGTQDALRCVLGELEVLAQDVSANPLTGLVCVANMPFIAQPEDAVPNAAYDEILLECPEISRRMNDVFRGQATLSYGDLVVKNEVSGDDLSARLDAWKTWNWDGRGARLLCGHPSWRRCDFKTFFLGAIQDIFEQDRGKLGFHLRGPEALFQRPLATALIGGTGPNAAALKPVQVGNTFNAEAILYDEATLTYQVGTGATGLKNTGSQVRDAGKSLRLADITGITWDQATGIYTSAAPHNLVVNAGVWAPAPLVGPSGIDDTCRFVVAVLSPTTFKISATRGGPVQAIPLAWPGGGYSCYAGLYGFDDVNGRVSLVSNPVGKVTFQIGNGPGVTPGIRAGQLIDTLAVSSLGAALAWDPFHGTGTNSFATGTVQFYEPSPDRALGDCVDEVAQTVGASANWSREGLFYLSIVDIPGATAAWTLTADDIRDWSQGERIPPYEVERLGYQRNYAIQSGGDLLTTVTAGDRDAYGRPYTLATYSPVEAGLEQPANHKLRKTPEERATNFVLQADAQAESQRLYALYRKTGGTYKFRTDPLPYELGEVVNITYPRDGFAGGKNAVIIGMRENAARGWVELEVFCQISGAWPVVSADRALVPASYY
jgi:hypothetical protein